MLKRIAKTTLFTTIVASVLCAGAVSARQLRSEATTTCSGSCNTSADCAKGCVCTTNTPVTPKFCSTHFVGAK
jgi:hypothetical protein